MFQFHIVVVVYRGGGVWWWYIVLVVMEYGASDMVMVHGGGCSEGV